jgi:hypothetical protein
VDETGSLEVVWIIQAVWRLCGSYRQSGALVMRFETIRLEDSND